MTSSATGALASATRTRRIPSGLARALLACAVARVSTFVVIWLIRFQDADSSVGYVMTRWDASFYLNIAASGYPDGPLDLANPDTPRLAFFPVWPLVLRGNELVGLERTHWALLVVTVCWLAFTALLWWLVADWRGPDEATWVATLAAFFPGSYVFTLGYTEPLFLVLAAAFFVLVRREQWVAAGAVAALAGAVRPNGVALVAAAAWLAWRRWRARSDFRPLSTLALAPVGLVAFVTFVAVRTESVTGYLTVQREGWDNGFDGGRTLLVDRVLRAIASPTYDWNAVVTALAFAAAVAGFVLLVRLRPPGDWVVYSAVVLGLAFLNKNPTSALRYTFTAFPVVVALAIVVRRRWRVAVLGASAALSLWLAYEVATSSTITP